MSSVEVVPLPGRKDYSPWLELPDLSLARQIAKSRDISDIINVYTKILDRLAHRLRSLDIKLGIGAVGWEDSGYSYDSVKKNATEILYAYIPTRLEPHHPQVSVYTQRESTTKIAGEGYNILFNRLVKLHLVEVPLALVDLPTIRKSPQGLFSTGILARSNSWKFIYSEGRLLTFSHTQNYDKGDPKASSESAFIDFSVGRVSIIGKYKDLEAGEYGITNGNLIRRGDSLEAPMTYSSLVYTMLDAIPRDGYTRPPFDLGNNIRRFIGGFTGRNRFPRLPFGKG